MPLLDLLSLHVIFFFFKFVNNRLAFIILIEPKCNTVETKTANVADQERLLLP